MKKLFLMLVFAAAGMAAMAQGVNFSTGTMAELSKKAVAEEKLLFVDVFTTWCGPCTFMSTKIFPTKEVGEAMNDFFVSAKIDAEKGEGKTVAKQYNVQGYPTMLIINPKDGKELGRIVGSTKTPEDFVKVITDKLLELNQQ